MTVESLGEGTVSIDRIETGARLRPVSEAGVVQLITSIEELGHLTDPIQVRLVSAQRGRPERLLLMAGAHRLAAARRLGWTAIRARKWRCNDAEARLFEIDDNLASAELSALDRSLFMAERKRVYLTLHPETGSGARGWKQRRNSKNEIVSFCVATAETFGRSVRWAEQYCAIGEALAPEEVAAIRAAGLAGRMTELLQLARLAPSRRLPALELMAAGRAKTVIKAERMLLGRREPPERERNWQRMLAAWARLDADQKAAFLAQVTGEGQILELADRVGVNGHRPNGHASELDA